MTDKSNSVPIAFCLHLQVPQRNHNEMLHILHVGKTSVTHPFAGSMTHREQQVRLLAHMAGALLHQQAAQLQGCREGAEEPLTTPCVCQGVGVALGCWSSRTQKPMSSQSSAGVLPEHSFQ